MGTVIRVGQRTATGDGMGGGVEQPVKWKQVREVFGRLELRRSCDDTSLLEVLAMQPKL